MFVPYNWPVLRVEATANHETLKTLGVQLQLQHLPLLADLYTYAGTSTRSRQVQGF